MAQKNNAIGNLTASVFRDEMKGRFSGQLLHTPKADQYWVYKTHSVPVTPAPIFVTTDEFMANERTGDSVAVDDKVIYLVIKHTGYLTSSKTSTTREGIMLNYSGADPLFDGNDGADTNSIFISPKELFIVKLNGVLVEDLQVGTCVLDSNGLPSALGIDTVYAEIAAIIEDITA